MILIIWLLLNNITVYKTVYVGTVSTIPEKRTELRRDRREKFAYKYVGKFCFNTNSPGSIRQSRLPRMYICIYRLNYRNSWYMYNARSTLRVSTLFFLLVCTMCAPCKQIYAEPFTQFFHVLTVCVGCFNVTYFKYKSGDPFRFSLTCYSRLHFQLTVQQSLPEKYTRNMV